MNAALLRRPLPTSSIFWLAAVASLSLSLSSAHGREPSDLLAEFRDPPREFSVMPFWFWNDDLKEAELRRQIADFEAHGVYGFVIHPRVGLPQDIGWLSPRMLHCMKVAVEEAERRKMYVILADATYLPDQAAKVCFQHQRDFNYLELRHLGDDAEVAADGVHLAGMNYRAVILDGLGQLPEGAVPALEKLAEAGRLLAWGQASTALKGVPRARTAEELVAAIDRLIRPDLSLDRASPDVRCRHVIKQGWHFYLLFNEGPETVTAKVGVAVPGKTRWLDPYSAEVTDAPADQATTFHPHELRLLLIAK